MADQPPQGDPPPPPPQKHYCNVTFLSVGDIGPDGLPIERLLVCSRCRETYYCGKEQQRAHWNIHKNVCRPASSETGFTEFRDFQFADVALSIMRLVVSIDEISHGRQLRHLFEKLQSLCSNSSQFATSEEEAILQGACAQLGNLQLANNHIIERLWAIPGMATFLLNLELISNTMRQRKLEGVAPTNEELKFQGHDPSYQNTCPYFANAICYLLLSTIHFDQTDPSLSSTGYVVYRNTAVAAIAAQKMMQWYKDPYTRASIPTTQNPPGEDNARRGPREYHFPSALEVLMYSLPDDLPVNNTAVVPGLSIEDTIEIITSEPAWQFYNRRAGEDQNPTYRIIRVMIRDVSRVKPMAWETFSSKARAVAAHRIVGSFGDLPQVAQMIGTDLLNGVLGVSRYRDSADEILWLKVIKLAKTRKSADGIDFPYGRHTDFFAQWYARASEVAASLFHELFGILLEQCNGFSRDLLPPEPVLTHISEYTMEAFSDYPSNLFSD